MTTMIQKWGNSQGVRIPKVILDSVNWSENEKIVIIVDNGKLVIEKAKEEHKRKNIKELFKDYKEDYTPYPYRNRLGKNRRRRNIVKQK